MRIAHDGGTTFAGDVTVSSTTLKISGDFPQLFFEDTASSSEDAYIVNNANGLFIGKQTRRVRATTLLHLIWMMTALAFRVFLLRISIFIQEILVESIFISDQRVFQRLGEVDT